LLLEKGGGLVGRRGQKAGGRESAGPSEGEISPVEMEGGYRFTIAPVWGRGDVKGTGPGRKDRPEQDGRQLTNPQRSKSRLHLKGLPKRERRQYYASVFVRRRTLRKGFHEAKQPRRTKLKREK